MEDMKWKRLGGRDINIKKELESDLKKYKDFENDFSFIVGCDSQVLKNKINFIISLVFMRNGHGASVYYFRDSLPKENIHIQRRLWEETSRAVDTARFIDDFLIEKGFFVSEIHSDLNPSKKYKSSEMVAACTGFIKSFGYVPKIKPESYVASKVADKRTRNRKK